VQLLALRPDLRIVGMRGNVDSRVRKVEAGEYDGAVLAAAGIERLGLSLRIDQVFSLDEVVPAAGQGVVAIECRSDDAETAALLRRVNDEAASTAAAAERAFLERLGAGCRLPLGAYAHIEGGRVHLRALLADAAGTVHRDSGHGAAREAIALGRSLAERLARAAGLTLESPVPSDAHAGLGA
jgi:hydroxymethylbilane synthase